MAKYQGKKSMDNTPAVIDSSIMSIVSPSKDTDLPPRAASNRKNYPQDSKATNDTSKIVY
jgi:hypothetical protein